MSRNVWIGGTLLALMAATALGADNPAEGPKLQAGPVRVQLMAEPVKLGDYWLGLGCHAAGDALRAQLGLPEGQGLVVANVVPESPAAVAGIRQHDVLLTVGDKPLGEINDLIDVIEATKEKPLAIELIRGGKKKQLTATPAKRPEEARGPLHIPLPEGADWDRIDKWLERVQPGERKGGPWHFRFFHPGTILPPGAKVHPPLPGNMRVTITKEGERPAKITVKRGDDSWEVTEENVDELPEDVRPHVERLLGNLGPGPFGRIEAFDFVPDWTMPEWPKEQIRERLKSLPEGPAADRIKEQADQVKKQMEKQLEEMNRRIEDLRKSLDELREKVPRAKAPKKNPDRV